MTSSNGPTRENDRSATRIRQTELIISHTLRLGVGTSVTLILLGMTLSFARHPKFVSSKADLPSLTQLGAEFPHTIHGTLKGLGAFRGQALVVLGLLVLIATPVVRVVISIVAFIHERDRVFVGITTLVLVLLLLSFFLGRVSG
ncbi:MAG: DUF1634 domain-containing protein [Planctomycetes bacterium]|nr:DUF1634 domain-containing protein [Planctomycetota bacterium]MBI3834439.1 DUF1634 domain-containing protein [Planctomycetota bacterium]